MSKEWITLNEASERTGLSAKTLRRYINSGELRGYRLGERIIRLRISDVDSLFIAIPFAETETKATDQ